MTVARAVAERLNRAGWSPTVRALVTVPPDALPPVIRLVPSERGHDPRQSRAIARAIAGPPDEATGKGKRQRPRLPHEVAAEADYVMGFATGQPAGRALVGRLAQGDERQPLDLFEPVEFFGGGGYRSPRTIDYDPYLSTGFRAAGLARYVMTADVVLTAIEAVASTARADNARRYLAEYRELTAWRDGLAVGLDTLALYLDADESVTGPRSDKRIGNPLPRIVPLTTR